MRTVFQRESLYAEVWAMPMTKLAAKYELSDNGLRKICKALSVPMPKAGHWTLAAIGRAPAPEPLPRVADRLTFASDPPKIHVQKPQPVAEEVELLRSQLQFERSPENRIRVDELPAQWHPSVRPISDWVTRSLIEQDKREKARALRAMRPRLNGELKPDALIRRGNDPILGGRTSGHALRVTPASCQRGLRILNALAFAAAKRSFAVELLGHCWRIRFSLGTEHADLCLSERLEVVPESPNRKPTTTIQVGRDWKATGQLRIHIDRPGSGVLKVEEHAGLPLEAALNKVFEGVYRILDHERKYRRRMLEMQEQAEVCRVKELERERQRDVQRKLIANEKAKREELLSQSASFSQAQQIRALVSAVEARALESELVDSVARWKSWALKIADGIDPVGALIRREVALLASERAAPSAADGASRRPEQDSAWASWARKVADNFDPD